MEDIVTQIQTIIENTLHEPIFLQAFTHSSAKGIDSSVAVNDRMELVGDKVIDLLLYDWLYKYTNCEKGKMDDLRKKIHSDKYLSTIFDKFQLDKYVRRNPGTELNVTIKANIMESLFFAAYSKGDLNLAYKFWFPMILSSI